MSDNALLRIRDAEAKAEEIIADAHVKAGEILANAQRDGAEYYEKRISASEAKAKTDAENITVQAKKLAEKIETESKAEFDSIVNGTQLALKAAVKEIIWGIMEQCR